MKKENLQLRSCQLRFSFPVYSYTVEDLNNDQKPDIFVNGNFHGVRPLLGRYDASFGTILIQNDSGELIVEHIQNNGITLKGEIRDTEVIQLQDGNKAILVSQNDGELIILKVNRW